MPSGIGLKVMPFGWEDLDSITHNPLVRRVIQHVPGGQVIVDGMDGYNQVREWLGHGQPPGGQQPGGGPQPGGGGPQQGGGSGGGSGGGTTIHNNPTINPTISPTISPTVSPTISPTVSPTISPTISPTNTANPTNTNTNTANPTNTNTASPTISPTISPTNTNTTTVSPTISPTNTQTNQQQQTNTQQVVIQMPPGYTGPPPTVGGGGAPGAAPAAAPRMPSPISITFEHEGDAAASGAAESRLRSWCRNAFGETAADATPEQQARRHAVATTHQVDVDTYASTSGSRGANQRITERRAEWVRSVVRAYVSGASVEGHAHGEGDTGGANGQRDADSRRAQISLVPR
jgi:hypothetical protein